MALNVGSLMIQFGVDFSPMVSSLAQAKGQLSSFATQAQNDFKKIGQVANISLDVIADIGKQMGLAGAAIQGALTLATKAAGDFEEAINKTARVTGATGDELVKTKAQIDSVAKSLSEKTVFSATEAARALSELAERGFNPAKLSAEQMKPAFDLASATGGNLSETMKLVGKTMKAFGMDIKEMPQIVDVMNVAITQGGINIGDYEMALKKLGPAASQAGMSFKELSATLMVFDEAEVTMQQATIAMKAAFNALENPSKKAVDGFAQMGIKMSDVSLKTHSFQQVLERLAQAHVTEQQMMDIFGNNAGTYIGKLLEMSSSGKILASSISLTVEQFQKMNGVTKEMADERMKGFSGQVIALQHAWENLYIELGQTLLPKLVELIGKLTTLAQATREWAASHKDIVTVVMQVVSVISGLFTIFGGLSLVITTTKTLVNLLKADFTALGVAMGATGKQAEFGFVKGLGVTTIGLRGAAVAVGVFAAQMVVATAAMWGLMKIFELGGAIMGWVKAMDEAQKAMNGLGTTAKNNYDRANEAVTKSLEPLAKANPLIAEQVSKLNQLTKEYDALSESALKNGRVSEEEARLLNEKGIQITQQLHTLEQYRQSTSDVATAQKEVTASTEETTTVMDTYNKTLSELSAQERELVLSHKFATESGLGFIDGMQKQKVKAQEFKDLVVQMNKSLKEMGAVVTVIKVDYQAYGADELVNTMAEIRRIDNSMTLERLSGLEKIRAQIRMEMQETLEALAVRIEKFRYEYELKKVQRQMELEEALNNIAKIDGLDAEKKKAAEDRAKALNEKMTKLDAEYYKKALDALNILGAKVVEQAAQKDQLAVQAQAANAKEAESIKPIIDNNATAVKSYEDRRIAAQNAIAAEGASGGGLGYASSTFNQQNHQPTQFEAQGTMGGASQLAQLNAARNNFAQYSTPSTYASTSGYGASLASKGVLVSSGGVSNYKTGTGTGVLVSSGGITASQYKGFQGGTSFVPSTGMYMLHTGEKVTPRGFVEGKGGGTQITIVNMVDKGLVNEFIKQDPSMVVNVIGADIARGGVMKKVLNNLAKGW